MTADQLREVLLSTEFRTGLEEVSSYLASITQERPIVHLLAKCLWSQKRFYALERNERHDLTIWTPIVPSGENETNIEFKFNYETCAGKLRKEIKSLAQKIGGNVSTKQAKDGNWGVMPRIWKDVCDKKPDMFVWIICSRDLSGIGDNDLKRIVNWKPLKKYRLTHAYKTDREFLSTIDGFLKLFQQLMDHQSRPFSVSAAEIETNGYFPSTYHFRICDFASP